MSKGITRHESSGLMSSVVEAGGFVHTAGVVADNLDQDVKAQTREVLAEIDRRLALCGTDKSAVISATIWVPDIRLREPLNAVWNEWTGGANLPGRACVEAALADPRALVEIAVIAYKG
jgi:enamine deaminase RidA (YjgF/YER057c/UK114 family)